MKTSPCSRCGQPPSWLVTHPYSDEVPAGRVMLYCERCRRDAAANLAAAIPLAAAAVDPAATMRALYQAGYTETEPTVAADVLGFDDDSWVSVAEQHLRSPLIQGGPVTVQDHATLGWDDPALAVATDSPRTARYRRLQSKWREEVLHLPPGVGPSGQPVGSMLPVDAPDGAQWLTADIAAFVHKRTTAPFRPGDADIETGRLDRNLLSSQPMCFNLFAHLDAHRDAAARVLARVLPWELDRIEEIRVEYAPPAAVAVLHDRTAFDAYVQAHTAGEPMFLAVETKYTEPFSRRRYEREEYTAATNDPAGWFIPGSAARAVGPVTNQLWRNAMLAQATEQHGPETGTGHVVVLSASNDTHAQAAVSGLRPLLKDPDKRICHIILDDIVTAAELEPDLHDWAAKFAGRYLLTP